MLEMMIKTGRKMMRKFTLKGFRKVLKNRVREPVRRASFKVKVAHQIPSYNRVITEKYKAPI